MFLLSAVCMCRYTLIHIVCVHVCQQMCVRPLRLNLPLFMYSPTSVSNHCFYQHSFLTLMCVLVSVCVCVCILMSMVWKLVKVQPHTCICLIPCVHVNVSMCLYIFACACVVAFTMNHKKENTPVLGKFASSYICICGSLYARLHSC